MCGRIIKHWKVRTTHTHSTLPQLVKINQIQNEQIRVLEVWKEHIIQGEPKKKEIDSKVSDLYRKALIRLSMENWKTGHQSLKRDRIIEERVQSKWEEIRLFLKETSELERECD